MPLISQKSGHIEYYMAMDKNGAVSKTDISSINRVLLSMNTTFLQAKDKVYFSVGSDMIRCLDIMSGELVWQQKLQEVVRASPIIEHDILYLRTINNGLYSINTKSGKILWYNASSQDVVTEVNIVSPIIYKNSIIIQNDCGDISVFNKHSGLEEWNFDGAKIDYTSSSSKIHVLTYQPLILDNFLYFYTSDGYLFKLNLLDRQVIWKKKYNIDRSISIHNNIIYIINDQDIILAINSKTGCIIWSSILAEQLDISKRKVKRYWGHPIIKDNTVYIASSKDEVLTFRIPIDTNVP